MENHWPEYVIEATCLGLFMIAAFSFGAILEHPASPVRQGVTDPLMRPHSDGAGNGRNSRRPHLLALGQQSGAHINPSTTITFFRLGKVAAWDAIFYVGSQFLGGLAGALLASVALSSWTSHPAVNYVVTSPGSAGALAAFVAEFVITFVLMTVILHVSNNVRAHKFTGLCAGVLVAVYITFEAPLSGMSMNPARTSASALAAQHWTAIWIYFTAPLIGMLAAAEVYLRTHDAGAVACAKLHHQNKQRCIFCGKPSLYDSTNPW